MPRTRALALALLGILLAGFCAGPAASQNQVGPEELRQEIQRLEQVIRQSQGRDGSLGGADRFVIGQTSLGIMALRAAGASSDDPVVRRAAEYLADNLDQVNRGTYEISLAIVALQNVDPKRYREHIVRGTRWLIEAQQDSGGWAYGKGGRTDNSNSQYAVLGLHAAAMSGLRVPAKVWKDALIYWRTGQQADGGWAYTVRGNQGSYGSMTCAGIASTYLCNMWFHVASGRCGYYPDDEPVNEGLEWIARRFDVRQNPQRGGAYKWYYLYALERVGVILARREFGRHDWYRTGVEHLVGVGAPGDPNRFYQKCFRLLFLGKGNAPLLIHKAQHRALWQANGRASLNGWNRNVFDIKFLLLFAEQQLDRFLDWQIVRLDAPLDELLKAPILYVSGTGTMRWTEQEKQRFKDYVAAGGFVLVEAANGNPSWDRSFRNFLATHFPEDNLVKLDRDHPLYTTPFELRRDQRRPLEAIMGPCWISVLYVPSGISCRWDIADFDHPDFRLGMNIISYAVNEDDLKGKLEEVEYSIPTAVESERRRGAFTIGQLVHSGDWKPHKLAWNKVLSRMNQKVGIEVYNKTLPIEVGENRPYEGQMLYLTSSQELELTEAQKEALKKYVERGGFIFAEAACSSPEFDRSFRALMEELYPDRPLQQMPVGHPLFDLGEQMQGLAATDALKRIHPGIDRPLLEHIEVGDRAVIVYTKYDISSAIEGHPCNTCPSILEPSASRLALKIVLYGLTS